MHEPETKRTCTESHADATRIQHRATFKHWSTPLLKMRGRQQFEDASHNGTWARVFFVERSHVGLNSQRATRELHAHPLQLVLEGEEAPKVNRTRVEATARWKPNRTSKQPQRKN